MAGPSGQTPVLDIPYPIPADTVDVPRDNTAMANQVESTMLSVVPVGAGMMWLLDAAPVGWLILDGHVVVSADYPLLAAKFPGWVAGGLLTLPNFQDRVPIGKGAGQALLDFIGNATINLAIAQLPAHKHVITDPGHIHGHNISVSGANANTNSSYPWIPMGNGAWEATPLTANLGSIAVARQVANLISYTQLNHSHGVGGGVSAHNTGITMADAGQDQPVDVRQKSVVINFIIRAA